MGGPKRNRCLDHANLRTNLRIEPGHGRGGGRKVPGGQERACFLQRAFCVFERQACRSDFTGRNPHFVSDFQSRVQMHDLRIRRVDCRFSLAARSGLVVSSGRGGVLCTFAGIDSAREGETIVSLVDGFARLLERAGRGGEGLWRVLFGTGLTRGVDGLLCLIDLFPGRF